ncbi:MAG: hypothetical protein JXM73_13315 [Anaerolineae bacterium]|nr:hypothetical protein [Anaerolineae bacterium]
MMESISRSEDESLRRRLQIPDQADRVLIFAESSHWDPNWMLTSEAYYQRFVHANLDAALDALESQPRRVYSIECVFFLRMYWDRCPAQRERLGALINEGRLRLTSSGVTTADTLLPSTEAILRDLLLGQEWLRANGLHQEPRLAYFADSFGCSPALPSLLNAAGFDRTAITRVDGMHFVGCDLEPAGRFPRPGSSAELLLKKEGSLDFVWRDRSGAELLCHWNAYTYGQGDMLAFRGLTRVYLVRVAWPARSDRHVARRIGQYVAQLQPYSRTPYLFCPIGFDFVEPIPDLVELLDRYNQNHYPQTGIWAVLAGLDDYLALVEDYRDQLPVLALDPNPYWTGFYTARPALKQRCHHLVDDLLLAERLSWLPENRGAEPAITTALQDAWWHAAASNHHDFITGTSPDPVVDEEQIPWLEEATASARAAINRLSPVWPEPAASTVTPAVPAWQRRNGMVEVRTSHYLIQVDEKGGGTIASLHRADTGQALLTGPSNELIGYQETGGLWRMGHEFWGGRWKEKGPGQVVGPVEVREVAGGLELSGTTVLGGETFRRSLWLRSDSPLIRCCVEGRAAARQTVTVRWGTDIVTERLVMDTPGGVIARPPQRIYDPTFWPFQHLVSLSDEQCPCGLVLLQALPGAVSYRPGVYVELVAHRNATREKMFGLVPIPGNPATGHEREMYALEYALLFTAGGDWPQADLPLWIDCLAESPWDVTDRIELRRRVAAAPAVDRPDVRITAVKPASRGEGVILRLYTLTVPDSAITVTWPDRAIRGASLCDARERDIRPLAVEGEGVRLHMPGTIATLRLLF